MFGNGKRKSQNYLVLNPNAINRKFTTRVKLDFTIISYELYGIVMMGHDILTAILICFPLGLWGGFSRFLRELCVEALNFGLDPTRTTHDSFFQDLAFTALFLILSVNYVFDFHLFEALLFHDVGDGGFSLQNLVAIITGLGVGFLFRNWQPQFLIDLMDIEEEKLRQSKQKPKHFNFDPFWDHVERATEQQSRQQQGRREQENSESQSSPFQPRPGTKPIRVTHLATLGLSPDATLRDIKKAYKKMARKYHPDMVTAQGGSAAQVQKAESQMKGINAAYSWLTD